MNHRHPYSVECSSTPTSSSLNECPFNSAKEVPSTSPVLDIETAKTGQTISFSRKLRRMQRRLLLESVSVQETMSSDSSSTAFSQEDGEKSIARKLRRMKRRLLLEHVILQETMSSDSFSVCSE